MTRKVQWSEGLALPLAGVWYVPMEVRMLWDRQRRNARFNDIFEVEAVGPLGNLGSLSRYTPRGIVASLCTQCAIAVLSRQRVIVRLRRGRDHWRGMESHAGLVRVPLV